MLRKHTKFDPFGRVKGQQFYARDGSEIFMPHAEAVDQLFYFQGREWDADAQLQNSRARWYSPSIGRFLSEDPSGVSEGNDPNAYRYVGNGVTYRTDPTGLRQAGNPLDSLYGALGGAYRVGPVQPFKPISPFLASSNVPVNTGALLGVQKFTTPTPAAISPFAPTFQDFVRATPLPSYDDYNALVRSTYPTRQQFSNTELNPHGPVVSVQTIASPVYGDIFRSPNETLKNFIQTTNSPLAAGVAQFVRPQINLVGRVIGGIVDAALPASDPRYVVTYSDRTRGLFIGEGPTTGGLAAQASLLAPPLLSGASRPAGTLTLRNAPEPRTIALSNVRSGFVPLEDLEASALQLASRGGLPSNPAVQYGNLFNRVRANSYDYNELYVENAAGRFKLDSYNPGADIVSRKFTQLADISERSATAYIREAATKYASGSRIANVPSKGPLAGQRLRGQLYLEVPIQIRPIPPAVLDAAARHNVLIRDVSGQVH